MNEVTIKIPDNLSEITIGQYLQYKQFLDSQGKEDPDSLAIKTVEIFCNISLGLAEAMSWSDVEDINEKIVGLFEHHDDTFQDRIKINGVEYGFIPNLEAISWGELIDLDDLIGQEDKLHEAMAVLYRPLVQKKFIKGLYENLKGKLWNTEENWKGATLYQIEKYYTSDKYSEEMKDMPLSVALGALGFISHLGDELLRSVLTSTKKEDQSPEVSRLVQMLEESGVGTFSFASSLKITSY